MADEIRMILNEEGGELFITAYNFPEQRNYVDPIQVVPLEGKYGLPDLSIVGEEDRDD